MTEAIRRQLTNNPLHMIYLVIIACGYFFSQYQKSCDDAAKEYRATLAEISKRDADTDAELAKQIAVLNQNITRLADSR